LAKAVFDLQAKALLTNSAAPGGNVNEEYNAFNAGFVDSGPVRIDFYLSANPTITTADTLVSSLLW
jgi:hypothetical protein